MYDEAGAIFFHLLQAYIALDAINVLLCNAFYVQQDPRISVIRNKGDHHLA